MIEIVKLNSPNRMRLWIEPVLSGCTLEKATKLQDIACKDEIELRSNSSYGNKRFVLRHHQEFFLVNLKDECDLTQLETWLNSDMLQFSWICNIHHGLPTQERLEEFLGQKDVLETSKNSEEQQYVVDLQPEDEASSTYISKPSNKVATTNLFFDEFLDADSFDDELEDKTAQTDANSTLDESMMWPDLAYDSVEQVSIAEQGVVESGTTSILKEGVFNAFGSQALGVGAVANASDMQALARQIAGLSLEIEVVFIKQNLQGYVLNILPEEWVKSGKNEAEAVSSLQKVLQDCRLKAYGKSFYFYLPNQKSDKKQLTWSENSGKHEANKDSADLPDGMLILGSAGCVSVQIQFNQKDYRFIGKINRSITFEQLKFKDNLTACACEIKCDPSAKDDFNNFNTHKALQLAQNNPSIYLKLWSQYNAIELETHARLAKERGYAVYNKYVSQGNSCFDFWLEPGSFYSFKVDDIVDVSIRVPQYNGVSSELDIFENQLHGRLSNAKDKEQLAPLPDVYLGEVHEVSNWDRKTIRIAFKEIPNLSAKGFISLSLRGYQVQHQRRENALNRLKEGTTGIRSLPRFFNLHDLDEQNPQLIQDTSGFKGKKGKNIEALTPRVRNKVFKHDPTINQLDAISMALNTPDIALIQGPPGTGKTTVIQAIVERLNEIMYKDKNKQRNLQGQILISSYQHEAVDNAISRLSLNSLPTFKFGNRRSDTNQRIYRACDQWRLNVLDRLYATYGDNLKLNPDALQVQKAIAQYECEPNDVHAQEIVRAIASLPQYVFNDELNSKLREEVNRLSRYAVDVDLGSLENSLQHVYALRTDASGFKDDGLFNLHRAYAYLEPVLGGSQLKQRLHYLCSIAGSKAPNEQFFSELKQLQQDLILYLQPKPMPVQQKSNRSTMELIQIVNERIEQTAANYEISASEDEDRKVLKILSRFANTLENNFAEVNSTLRSMNVVVAATVQQTMNNDLISYKRRLAGDRNVNDVIYDTVIIDEAARSMPIDLLIPMVLASRRIILVGDHKQLPHIVDDMIERQLLSLEKQGMGLGSMQDTKSDNAQNAEATTENDLSNGTDNVQQPDEVNDKKQLTSQGVISKGQEDALHEHLLQELNHITPEQMLNLSMFEFLFSNLKKLEAQDGIARTITLDHQFRMHPALGQLISSEFYDGQLFSPLDASFFDHNLNDAEHCYARWYNIPAQMGVEERKGTSRIRLYEAQCIIWQLKKWLKDPSSRGMSFGVVCFYREQVNLLRELAVQAKIFTQDGDRLKLAEPYEDVSVLDRIRIDTVDAFQGKEFDVVMLSMVRSISSDKLNQAFKRLTQSNKADISAADFWSLKENLHLQQKVFGHLMSLNRLCVALSRQRKMLCVFGDLDLIEHPLGQHAVPALFKFAQMCKKEKQVHTLLL